MIAVTVAALWVGACPVRVPTAGAPGLTEIVHVPAPHAVALNNEGKALYRQGQWDAARAKYEAADAADPDFLAPALNAACVLARQERHTQAVRAAVALVHRGFVPWGREVREAADLAVLHVRPEMRALETALAQAAAAWGQSVEGGLFFVARTKPPVRIDGSGVLVLALNQEIFSWQPRTGRYRQVSADDGRVLAFARSPDGRTVVYLRAGKLVRAGAGVPPVLRGLSLRRLELPSMAAGPAVDIPGDVTAIDLAATRPAEAELTVSRPGGEVHTLALVGDVLVPVSRPRSATQPARRVRLDASGVARALPVTGPSDCRFVVREDRTSGRQRVVVRSEGREMAMPAPFGAGIFGLAFPVAEPTGADGVGEPAGRPPSPKGR